jgi:predicted transcriptional regulator
MSSDRQSSKPDLYVVARIVNGLRERGQVKRTQLATMTGLSYDSLVKYLEWMSEKGFVRFDEEGNVLLTPEGFQAYDRLVKWILEYVGKLKFPRL